MSCSYSAGSASSSSDGQQLGARPKIGRQQVHQPMKPVGRSSATQQGSTATAPVDDTQHNKEWNSNWNSILSVQADGTRPIERKIHPEQEVRIKNINGQPPSTVGQQRQAHDATSNGRPAVSRGFSDPILAVAQQPVSPPSTATCRLKSVQMFHSQHYEARRQRDRQQQPTGSRSNSAADLSPQPTNLSAASSCASSLNNVSQDSRSAGGGGKSSIWARWFRRSSSSSSNNNNNNNNGTQVSTGVRPFSSSYGGGGGGGGGGAGSRSHSVENSPVVSRRHGPMTASSGQLASDNSDSLSTNSFSFIRTAANENMDPALTLRRKYGLMACSNESTDQLVNNNHINNNNMEGEAIRAMRTRWESQMKDMDETRTGAEEKCGNKRPSHPHTTNGTARKKRPAPQPPGGSTNRRSTGSIRASSITSAGLTHVPGKRKAPSPPHQQTTQFNISVGACLNKASVVAATAAPPAMADDKWNNELNCNLLVDETSKVKVLRYHQNKINNEEESQAAGPRNDSLKLEDGVLRPLGSAAPNTNEQTNGAAATLDGHQRGTMTLPLKPWYKRGRNGSGSPLHHHPSSANAASRSRWKDAALLHHPPSLQPPPTLINTIGSNHSSTMGAAASTPSQSSSSQCSDGSKGQHQRKSLLVNISQLDREATEIIQRERARESQRKRMEDDKFYSHVPDVAEETMGRHLAEEKATRHLINMFNSFSDSSPTAINSRRKQTIVEPNLRLGIPFVQPPESNYKSSLEHGTAVALCSTVPQPAEPECATACPTNEAVQLNSSTITRLRVNRETIAAPASTAVGHRSELPSSKQSIFNPILEVVGLRHNGGARPKDSIVPSTDKASPMVNGYAKLAASGWECHICTLVNSEPRLWCEACTALKPRQVNTPPSGQIVNQSVAKETIEKTQVSSAQTTPISSAGVTVTTAPNSPEALRQARLAFFLNSQQNRQHETKEESDHQPGDQNNNKTTNIKRRSQYGCTKVSSSCQTQDLKSPSNKEVQQPVLISDEPHLLGKPSDHSNRLSVNQESSNGPIDNNDVKPRVPAVVVKDVTPTNFALLSPSRTQLSQYLQQQQAAKMQSSINGHPQSSNDIQKSADESSPGEDVSDEKRVEVMLWRLEEAIASGQFDKAAVLARELAAIKRAPPSQSPSIKRRTLETDDTPPTPPAVMNKPVAAPRSVLSVITPAVVEQKQSDPIVASPSSAHEATVAVPLPAKRLSHVSSPLPSPRKTVRHEEEAKQEETLKNEVEKDVIIPRQMNNPEVTIRTKKRGTKISSGQQTTLTFQKKPSSGVEENVRRTQSCIVDDTFNVGVFIEDRSTHSGPFHLPVRPATTLLELKERMAKSHGIAMPCQRWILGRRLADKEQLTLKEYDICPSNSSLFLYVLPDLETPTDPSKPSLLNEPPSKPDPVSSAEQRPDQHAQKYYNYQEDRYSTCEEDSDEETTARPIFLANNAVVRPSPVQHLEPDSNKTELYTAPVVKDTLPSDGAVAVLEPTDTNWTCPGCNLANPTIIPDCKTCAFKRPLDQPVLENRTDGTKVDYNKLVDLLDQNDVVANADGFDCPVCLMSVPAGVGVTLRECLHNFCRDCLAHVIEFSDEATITCPYRDDHYACDAILQEREIKNLVCAKLYEKHLERSMRLAEKAMKNAFHCQTADCPGWAIIEEDNINIFRCPVCRKSNCLTCQAIHEGANCKEFQDRVNQSAETDEDAKRTKEMIDALVASGEALSCPQCQVVLMKRWGCDWVRCSVCRTEICWVTKQNRWGPKGKGDTSGGCRCGVDGIKCHPSCNYCH